MPRKKRKSSGRKSGRRRVGAVSMKTSDTLQMGAGVVIGVLATRFATKLIPASVDPAKAQKIAAAVELVGGGVLAWKSKNPLVKGAGLGLAAGGALQLGQSFGIISGIGAVGDTFMMPTKQLNGYNPVQRIGNGNVVDNYPKPSAIGKGIGSYIG